MMTRAKNVSTKWTTRDKEVFSEDVPIGFSGNLYLIGFVRGRGGL